MNDGKTCKKVGMKCLIPVAAVFVVLFVFQWLYHGIYMLPAYEATADMWRSEAEMQELMWICYVTKLLMAFALSAIYCCVSYGADCQGKSMKKGFGFGLMIGLFLGAHDFASYIWMPIDMSMAIHWFVGDIIMGVLIGVTLAFVTSKCKGEGKTA